MKSIEKASSTERRSPLPHHPKSKETEQRLPARAEAAEQRHTDRGGREERGENNPLGQQTWPICQ